MIGFVLIAYLAVVNGLLRPKPQFIEGEKVRWSENYTDFVVLPNSIRLAFHKPKNNGFYVITEL